MAEIISREVRYLTVKELGALDLPSGNYRVAIHQVVYATFPGTQGPDLIFPGCGHTNTGTLTSPVSYHEPCMTCGNYYCATCDFDQHLCYGCGEYLTHRTEPHHECGY